MNQRSFSRRGFLKWSGVALAGGAGLTAWARGDDREIDLRKLADWRGRWIGPAVAYSPLVNEPIYADTLQREFNFLTPENAMKWAATHPQQNQYTFTQADAIFDFGVANGLAIHGHNLCWQSSNPSWLANGNFSRDQMIAILQDHIYTVAGRYSGSITAWDVVNEAVDGNGNLAAGIWRDRLGTDYVALAFQFARDADANALLVYNDYSAETISAKSNGIYSMVQSFQQNGIPIDGVGFQMHIGTNGIDYASFAQNLQRFADLGLALFVTEMDVKIQLPVTDAKLQAQAAVYGNVLEVVLNQPACVGFQMWGFTDKYSWINSMQGYGAALIFDANYQRKLAYYSLLHDLVAG
jgi:endo-1,4-beta-xylanase